MKRLILIIALIGAVSSPKETSPQYSRQDHFNTTRTAKYPPAPRTVNILLNFILRKGWRNIGKTQKEGHTSALPLFSLLIRGYIHWLK